MIQNEVEYYQTIRQWNRACSRYWVFLNIPDRCAGLYQRWRLRASQLEQRLKFYEQGHPRGWRGGRDNVRYLNQVQQMIAATSKKYP